MASRVWVRRSAIAGVLAGVLAPSLAFAQTLAQPDSVDVSWWRVAGALVLCIALAIGGAFALRVRLRGSLPNLSLTGRRLHLVESLRLPQQVEVCLLSCDGRDYLIAATPHGALLIDSANSAPAPAPTK